MSIFDKLFKKKEKTESVNDLANILFNKKAPAKNRVEADDINISYRTATANGFNQLDFVRGYEISLSNNADCSCSVCKLFQSVKGNEKTYYPKGWVFKGWHFGCKCLMIPLLQSTDDFMANIVNKTPYKADDISTIPDAIKRFALENREYANYQDWFLDNIHYFIDITDAELLDLKKKKAELHKQVSEMNLEASAYIKNKEREQGIKVYEDILKLNYPHGLAYDKLLSIYKRRKDYENMKRVLTLKYEVCLLDDAYFDNEMKEISKLQYERSIKK